jgi:hypothetical protein
MGMAMKGAAKNPPRFVVEADGVEPPDVGSGASAMHTPSNKCGIPDWAGQNANRLGAHKGAISSYLA